MCEENNSSHGVWAVWWASCTWSMQHGCWEVGWLSVGPGFVGPTKVFLLFKYLYIYSICFVSILYTLFHKLGYMIFFWSFDVMLLCMCIFAMTRKGWITCYSIWKRRLFRRSLGVDEYMCLDVVLMLDMLVMLGVLAMLDVDVIPY